MNRGAPSKKQWKKEKLPSPGTSATWASSKPTKNTAPPSETCHVSFSPLPPGLNILSHRDQTQFSHHDHAFCSLADPTCSPLPIPTCSPLPISTCSPLPISTCSPLPLPASFSYPSPSFYPRRKDLLQPPPSEEAISGPIRFTYC